MNVRIKERIILGAMIGAPATIILGLVLAFTGVAATMGITIAAMGVLAQGVVTRVIASMDHFRTIGPEGSGGDEYDTLQRQGPLRTASLALNAMTVFSVLTLVVALWARVGGQSVTTADVIARSVLVLNIAMAASWWMSGYESMRIPKKIRHTWLTDLFMQLALLFTLAFAVASLLAAYRDVTLFNRPLLTRMDAPIILLAGQAAAAVALFVARRLPNFYTIFRQDPGASATDTNRTRNVLLPTLASFGLLFVLILVLLAYGVGFADVIQQVVDNPIVITLLGVLLLVVIGVAVVAIRIGASQDQKPPRIKEKIDEEVRRENLLVLVSGLLAITAIGIGVMLRQDVIPGVPSDIWFDIIGVGVLVAIGPYGFYAANRYRRIRDMEDRFPDFLRDLASSHKGGLTLYASVEVAARGDYGALTPEVRKMADQLSWHVPFEEALARFATRVHTPLVERSVNLILEASRSGGSTTEVLIAAARDARELKNLENDRRLNMSVYTIVIYVTFMVFLLVAAILYARFVPSILETSAAAGDLGGGNVGGISFSNNLSLDDYRVFYFTAAIVQGIGDGIIAGLMGSGRAVLGLRHSFWMVLIAWLTFVFFI